MPTEKNWKFGCWTYNGEEGNHPQHLRNHPQHKDNHSTEHALFEAFNSATVLVGRRNGSNRSRRRNGLNRRRRLDKVHEKGSPARATSTRTPAPSCGAAAHCGRGRRVLLSVYDGCDGAYRSKANGKRYYRDGRGEE